MIPLLIGLIFTIAPPDSARNLEACLEIGPRRVSPPVTSLGGAQKTWLESQPIPRDTLRAHLDRVIRARKCYRNLSPTEVPHPYIGNILETYRSEAELWSALRQFPNAFDAYDAALSFLTSQSPQDYVGYDEARSVWYPRLHQQKGYLHYLLGDLSASIQEYLAAYRRTPETDVGKQIKFLIDVGTLQQRTQDYSSARYYYRRAEKLLQASSSTHLDRSSLQARLDHAKADILLEQTLNAEFEQDSLKRAAHLARRGRSAAAQQSERYARITVVLSESLSYLDSFEEAYRLNREIRRYARETENKRLQTFALLKLGVIHIQTENWERADSSLSDALELAENLGDLDYQRRILRAQGRLYEMRERWTDAEAAYRNAVSVVEEYRESLTASQWSMTAFAQWRDVHRGLTRSLLAQNRARKALTVLDRSRARHLQDLRTQARVSNEFSPEKRARLDSLSRELTEVRNRLSRAERPDSNTATLRNREASLMATRQQLLQVDTSAARPSLSEIAETLAEHDRTIVSYFLDDPWPVYNRSPRSTAFVLTPDTLHTVPLSNLTQDSVEAHVETISPLFTTQGKPTQANSMHFDLEPLHALYQQLYAPVREHLPEGQPLTVVPDGPLFHLPFSMLVDSMPGGRYAPSKARFVLHERPISLELASSLIADSAQTHDWSQFEPQLAAYGVSDFDTLETVPSALRTMMPKAVRDSSIHLPPLPGVQRELDALHSTFSNSEISLNGAATEPSFCRSAQKAGILHVASHAFVNASSPLQNAILLRDDSTQSESDGVLFLHELQNQQSRIPLVVLSGCSTAKGSLRGGEGMEGLQYAFRAMGAQSTLSTLWPVDDEASVTLMESFYNYLHDGLSKDRALRQAQLDYLDANPTKASPFFWSAPVLYGSVSSLPLDKSGLLPVWAWVLLGVAVAILLVGLLLWWQRDRLPAAYCWGPSAGA